MAGWGLIAFTLAFTLYHLADTGADPDLWGHVLFGQRMLDFGGVERTEPFSWTAEDYRWINHEVLAEVALGLSHRIAGGTGILLLKILVGFATFLIALRSGLRGLRWPAAGVAWFLGAIAMVEIGFGFAARPQIFTAVFLAAQLAILLCAHNRDARWALALPPLLVLWINTHGGALAGLVILLVVSAVTTAETALHRRRDASRSWSLPLLLWLSAALSAAGFLLNPWGMELPKFLLESVLWVNRGIEEWNRPEIGLDHGVLFVLAALVAFAFARSVGRWRWWEVVVVAAMAFAAVRSVRHSPLFAITALSLAPPYLVVALGTLSAQTERLRELARSGAFRPVMAAAGWIAAVVFLGATVKLRKENPFTMEVPRDSYPVTAIRFLQDHELNGNLLVFFNYGEQAIWELPQSRVSVDGRLDTCYPRKVLDANWDFWNGRTVDPKAMDLGKADVALLQRDLLGAAKLAAEPNWFPVYVDELVVVLVRDPVRFPKLLGLTLPVSPGPEATRGRAAFPGRRQTDLR